MTTALEGGEVSGSRPGRTLPPEKNPVPIVQKAGWAPGPVWRDAENLAPPEFDPRTVQPVASRYTDYATRPTVIYSLVTKIVMIRGSETETHPIARLLAHVLKLQVLLP